MKLLVDTHCWLWFLLAPDRLNARGRGLLRKPESIIYLSVASMWEIVIKQGLGKLELPGLASTYLPDRIRRLGHRDLPIRQAHVLALEELPQHHKDPFDRILLAQALAEGIPLMTADAMFEQYDVPLVWVGRGEIGAKD